MPTETKPPKEAKGQPKPETFTLAEITAALGEWSRRARQDANPRPVDAQYAAAVQEWYGTGESPEAVDETFATEGAQLLRQLILEHRAAAKA